MQTKLAPSSHAARRALRGLENTTPSPFSPSKLKLRTLRERGSPLSLLSQYAPGRCRPGSGREGKGPRLCWFAQGAGQGDGVWYLDSNTMLAPPDGRARAAPWRRRMARDGGRGSEERRENTVCRVCRSSAAPKCKTTQKREEISTLEYVCKQESEKQVQVPNRVLLNQIWAE